MMPSPTSVSATPLAERHAYVYLMMRGGGREEEVLRGFVSILKGAEGGREGGKEGRRRGSSSSGGTRRVRLGDKADGGEEGRGGREEGSEKERGLGPTRLVPGRLVRSGRRLCEKGKGGFGCGCSTSETLLEE